MLQNLTYLIVWFVQEPHGDHAPAGEDNQRPHRLLQQAREDSLNNNHVFVHVITSRALLQSMWFHSKTCKTKRTLLALLCTQTPLNSMLSVTVTFADYVFSQTLNILEKHVWFLHEGSLHARQFIFWSSASQALHFIAQKQSSVINSIKWSS